MSPLSQTKKAHLQEGIAKGIIWFFVVLTIVILAWIILYVLYRGFVSINHLHYQVTDTIETAAAGPDHPAYPISMIIQRKVRLKDDLTSAELFEMYTKRRQPNWGDITGQNLDVELFALTTESEEGTAGAEIILANRENYSKHVTLEKDGEAMIKAVSSTPGGIGFIPSAMVETLPRSVKAVPIRRIAAPVNASVKKIVENVQIQTIDNDDLLAIFTGKVKNWQEVGGIDLPIRPVAYSQNAGIRGDILNLVLGENNEPAEQGILYVDTPEVFFETIDSLPGAIGMTYWEDVKDIDDRPMITFDRLEVRQNLDWHYLVEAPARSGKWGGISTIIINTFFLILFTLLFSTPIGVLGAIYMVEYAKQGRVIRILRLGTETLAGIPSIVFGLFGFIFFVGMLGLGIGFISATLTVTMMILPTIIRTSEEALKSVPLSFREGSLALGATKLQTIAKVVVPAATPGILTGIILAVGRTVGETAVLIYTLGSNYELVRGPSSSARVLSLHLYNLFSEAISFDRSFATGAILIFIILLVNYSTTSLIGRLNKKAGK
ncbi:phosphate ABC transporter permease PstA [Sediminispirochaeta smaragdinae]|uniref:Phosphate transport system permease protein PstA n=1 Tax=Sediminispirochaeta smaragdinae (strain DSM 11293 / JCM 15392 / SEBR 4228) TaxID=573413 RepID=E1R662_SEDSS|nr:phosphate ABC transporter permease PstA [Sediminispirochaeta smaragdinae]ADK80827.1 phosphate ABC transporter, inner membrane subunit PstA [Sediminispirochaeta smaragdinae DSM 11293]